MKQNQKSNQKFNLLGTLLLVATFAFIFIFASGCVTTDIYSDMSEVIETEITKLGDDVVTVAVPVPGGIVRPVADYEDTYNPSAQQPTSNY